MIGTYGGHRPSRVRGSAWFVRLGLCYRRRAIPIAWRAYPGNSAMVGFDVYRQVLEQADRLGGLHLDAVRIAAPNRLDRLLLVLAVAYLYLVTAGDDVVARGQRAWVQPSDAYALSRFQMGCRYIRRAAWRGEAVDLRVHLQPDEAPRDLDDAERAAREVHHQLGLTPGQVWMPYRSFETENAYWWLPGKVEPRFPDNVWR